MVQRVSTVAFEGIEARAVDVQVQVAPGLPAFAIVGLPDKAVSEARERVRSALIASGLALPARRITVNLAPADVPGTELGGAPVIDGVRATRVRDIRAPERPCPTPPPPARLQGSAAHPFRHIPSRER